MAEGAEASSTTATSVSTENEASSMQFKAVVIGATGATGRFLVGELLNSKLFTEVSLLGRRKLTELPETFKDIDLTKEEESGHLTQHIVDFDAANEESAAKYFNGRDAFFSCFGTTRSAAGGAANFKKIESANMKFAEIAKKEKVHFCSLMSSSGANSRSFFLYLKVKGEIEDALTKLEFPLLSIFRPGFLDRMQPPRLMEKIAGMFMSKISVATVAKAMVNDAEVQLQKTREERPFSHILNNAEIFDIVKSQPSEQETVVMPAEEGVKGEATSDVKEQPKKDEQKTEQAKVKESGSVSEDSSAAPSQPQEAMQEPEGKDDKDATSKS